MKGFPSFLYLSDEQLERLHQAGLHILDHFGVRVEDPEIRKLYESYGCTVKGERVYIHKALVDKVLLSMRQEVTIHSRFGSKIKLEHGKSFSHSTGGIPWIDNALTGEKKSCELSDLISAIRVMNGLDNLDMPCSLVYPSDVDTKITQYTQCVNMFRYSKKPLYGLGLSSAKEANYIVELFNLFNGKDMCDNPVGMLGISPESPLFLPKEITDLTKLVVKSGIPVSILAAPMSGLTAPITLAGCVAQVHAEILSFAVLAHMINPKCLMIYGSRTFFTNMASGQSILGLPETGISSAVAVQLAQYCGFLTDVYGLATTGCTFDEQTGYEKAINAMLPTMMGGTLISGFGCLRSVLSCSLGQLVIDDEIFSMVKKAASPIVMDEDVFGFDALENVIFEGENFIEQEHTVDYLRKGDLFLPKYGFDGTWVDWVNQGEVPIGKKAELIARELIEKDEIVPFTDEVEKEIQKITAAATKELLGI